MKKAGSTAMTLLALSFLTPAFVLGAQVKDFSETMGMDPGGRLSLKTYKGTIHLTSWERAEVEIRATIEAPSEVDGDYARRSVDATRIKVRKRGSGLSIESDYGDVPSQKRWWPGSSRILPYVHYEIRAPRSITLVIDDNKSDIEVFGFEGRFDIDSYKGKIEARDLVGEIRIETHKGDAYLSGLRGGVDIETYKGDVVVELESLESDSSLDTYKGRITLRIPSTQKATLNAELSKKADFRTDFSLDRQHRSRYDFRASLNGGGPEIYVKSYKGDIRLASGDQR